MRQSPYSKRPRGGRPSGRRGNSHGDNRSLESSGPHAKIRGNPGQLFEKYQALARDATASGDRVATENYLQHAEHYFRVLNVQNSGQQRGNVQPIAQARPDAGASPAERPERSGGAQAGVAAAKVDGGGSDQTPA